MSVSGTIVGAICTENLGVYERSPSRLQEDVSNERQVASDYRGRLVYELLQNADDALAESASLGADRALFRLTDDELWVANTGRPFSDLDVRGLCGLGASSKGEPAGRRRASIGEKGLGFKSVLEITDAPEAYSDTVSFRLGKPMALDLVSGLWEELGRGAVVEVPVMRFPAPVDVDQPEWQALRGQGFHTAFRFPFHDKLSNEQKSALAHQLLSLSRSTVLFLKHLEEVVIEVRTADVVADRQWLLERHRVSPEGLTLCDGLAESGLYRVDLVDREGEGEGYWIAHDGEVEIGDFRDGLSDAWRGVDVTEVSVAVRDSADPRLDRAQRRFHVFLPTQESSGCSLLVNGAFSTDLSRQHVHVSEDHWDYNAHLVRRAAAVFAELLVPHLSRVSGPSAVLWALEPDDTGGGSTAELLRTALASELASAPLLPARDRTLSLSQAVLPSPVLASRGSEFADLLVPEVVIEGRQLPDSEYCEGELARICGAYGALALDPFATLRALAANVDPSRATFQPGTDLRVRADPVLDLCVDLWENALPADRKLLEDGARHVRIFPIGEHQDGTVNRIVLGTDSAFFPPQASSDDLPLRRLRFLAHAVCWGSLPRLEQSSVLDRQMRAWEALFGIKEFRFEEVMRAAVLPGLARTGTVDTELRESNRTIAALATICGLAGKTTKPDQPLPLARLGSDRAFFNLSRLEVPCRVVDGEPTWAPAYQVYFGRDWVGDDSVELIAEAMAAAGHPMDVRFLASPALFAEFASTVGVGESNLTSELDGDTDDGEVDLEDDTDTALETNVDDRWRNFFAWLGVSRSLRLVHFYDVDDSGPTWARTKGLGRPSGWAFHGQDEEWKAYIADIKRAFSVDPRWSETDHYLYNVHDLDQLDEIATAASRSGNDVADQLLHHLVRNWAWYGRRVDAQLALLPAGRRTPSGDKEAQSDFVTTVGPDYWLFRLRRRAICPTKHGPRRPDQTWRKSAELSRRLGRGGREPDRYVPVLRQPEDSSNLRACLDDLCVRGELTPAAFTIDDAQDLCTRIAQLMSGDDLEDRLRTELRPLYRELFELLVGSSAQDPPPLADAPLAARSGGRIKFLPARDVVYASVSGSRERSGVKDKVPVFVLEAEPGASAPLRNLFGCPTLENDLMWTATPGEASFDEYAEARFRNGLRGLRIPLLARLSADRPDRAREDARALDAFITSVEPVESLSLSCAFRGEDLGEVPQRTYFVDRSDLEDTRAWVVWSEHPWPPLPEDAQALAMAFAESLGVNNVETFLSFITATDEMRQQLLMLAGAAELVGDVEVVDGQADVAEREDVIGDIPEPSDGESTGSTSPAPRRAPPGPAAPRVPLHRFEDLLVDGRVIRVGGGPGASDRGGGKSGSHGGSTGSSGGAVDSTRAAAGTDLDELDQLGMRITFAFEQRRFPLSPVVVLPNMLERVDATTLVVDVSSPKKIAAAKEQSAVVKKVFDELAKVRVSEVHPGFDVLTINDGVIDRMIELKSSGVDAQVQAMSWNEWKTARGDLRSHFWLYLVGNLRADLPNAVPFIRAVHDPFGTLTASKHEDTIRKRTVQLRVREFSAADELKLTVRSPEPDTP